MKKLSVLLILGLALAGCGDDDGGGAGKGSANGSAAAAKKAAADKKKADDAKKKKKTEVISYIQTLEKVVPPGDAPTIRRRLKDRDFQSDLTGTENRNPFQSFTLPQVGEDTPATTTNEPPQVKPTDLCQRKQLVASNYAIKDLALIGIIRRNSQYFALFRDAKGVGHVIERGKCLGREKALVTAIGDGIVTIERIPDSIPGAPEPTPVTETIPLYKSEITADDFDEEEVQPSDETQPSTETSPPPVSPENPTPGPSATPPTNQ
jgi:Tfp pilus assembly protein PilP